MLSEVLGGVALAAAGTLAYGARARSATLFGPSVWRGPKTRRAIAITFDDGPSESTSELLSLLADYGARCTFFQCGHHVRRLPLVSRRCIKEGHEIGNHSDTHHAYYLRSPQFIYDQISRAQASIIEVTGVAPTLLRATYGVRWPGLAAAQERLGLLGVMWTTIARDWKLPAAEIVSYVEPRTQPGAILCFHDGRELLHRPDITPTLDALRLLLPKWVEAGYEMVTVSDLIGKA
ncbi:MAG: polysaccharide deacetylase family protein [Acidobacteria bacterium]|nr:polysaccharide deacetylase family protein [Acidobacteriota bacterium]